MMPPRRSGVRAAWLAAEDAVFAWAAKAEVKLKFAPPGVRLVPTQLHRWILRFIVVSFSALLVVFAGFSGAARTHAILATAAAVFCLAIGLLLIDAVRGMPGSRGGRGGSSGPNAQSGGSGRSSNRTPPTPPRTTRR